MGIAASRPNGGHGPFFSHFFGNFWRNFECNLEKPGYLAIIGEGGLTDSLSILLNFEETQMLVIKRLRSFFSRVFQHRRLTREIHSFQENILDQLNDLGGWKDIVDAGSILGILDNVAKRIAAIEDMSFNPVEFSNKFHQFNKNLTALIDVVYEKYSKVEIKRDQLEKKLDDVLFKLNRLDQIYDVLAVHLGDNEDEDGGAKMHRCFHTGEHLENVFEGEVPITIQDHVDALDTVISILKIRLNTRPDLFSEYRRKIQVLDSLKQHYLEKLNVIS